MCSIQSSFETFCADDFRKEDLARCLLDFTVKDLVNTLYMSCREAEVSTVFFNGGFVNHPLMRKLITKEWLGVDGMMAGLHLKEVFLQKYLCAQIYLKPN